MEKLSGNNNVIQWAARTVAVSELKSFEKNPRKISAKELDALKRSIAEDGYHQRILATHDLRIIGGHQRIKAMLELGYREVEVLVPDREISDEQFSRILVRDNMEYGTWDYDTLGDLLPAGELLEIGLGDAVVNKIERAAVVGNTDPDDVPEPPKEPRSAYGDVWKLGDHRVMCGNATRAEDIKKLIGDTVIDILFTDPPYGVKRDKGFGGSEGFGGKGKKIPRRQYPDDWDSERPEKSCFDLITKQAKIAIIWGGNFFADMLPAGTHWLVWDKLNTMPTFGDCELAWTNIPRNSVKKITIQYNGLIGKEKERFHPTQKPIALAEWCFTEYGAHGESVLDLFLGSGSTLIAAERTGRVCYGMELSAAYVDVVIKRWEDYTGKKAVRV